MTSKGQVTIPTAFRKQFGLQEGQKFDVIHSGDGILFVPQAGWDETFAAAEKIRTAIKKHSGNTSIDWEDVKQQTDNIKTDELRKKYFAGGLRG